MEINENKCEGLVPVRDLADDFYDLDEKNYCLVGRRHNHRYRLGDNIKVRVARANLDKKQLDFAIVDENAAARGEDAMGKTVTVEQALAATSAKKAVQHHGGRRKTKK